MNQTQHNSVDTAQALEDQAIEMLVHLHSGRAQPADHQAFQDWSQRSEAHRQAASMAESLWADLPLTATAQKLPEATSRPARRHVRRLILSSALAASLVLGLIGVQLLGPVAGWQAEYVTASGERSSFELEDGSRLWLNSGTRLSVDFNSGQRQVRLFKGEALFEVAPDPQRPFVVEAAGGRIQAIGTRFSVSLLSAANVVVSEGIVQVDSAARGVRLHAGQGVVFQVGGRPGEVTPVDADSALAWQRGKLIFNRQPLADVLVQLDRHLPGKLMLADQALGQLQVSGVFELDDPRSLLRTLEQQLPLRVVELPWLTLVRPFPGS